MRNLTADISNEKCGKAVALLIAVLFAAMTVLAFFYIVEEADHDCSGHHCPICACRHNCESIVQSAYCSDGAAASGQPEIVFFSVLQIGFSYIAVSDTLITRKVQLND